MDASETLAPAAPTRRMKPIPLEPIQHQWFDPWRTAKGPGLRTLVEQTLSFVAYHEEVTGARARARRPSDELLHRERLEAIVCELAYAVFMPPPTGRIAIKLGHGSGGRTRYDSLIMGKPLSPMVNLLEDLDIVDREWRRIREEVTSIAPTPWFAKRVAEANVQLSDFGRHENEEVVILTRNSRWLSSGGERNLAREPVDYIDDTTTDAYRAAIRQLNAFLDAADIDFVGDGLEPSIDPFERTLRRRFVIHAGQEPRLDQSGRLYGGFWQNLKSERRHNIRISREPVGGLDYSSMYTRLAYATMGIEPPPGDLYAIPGFEGYRSGVKLAMNCFLFDGRTRRCWPSELGVGVGTDSEAAAEPEGEAARFDGRLPMGSTVGRTKKAILSVHPALRSAWGTMLGYRLMFDESQILIAVLEELASRGVPALPLHDGLIVAKSQMQVARAVMVDVCTVIGVELPVSEKL